MSLLHGVVGAHLHCRRIAERRTAERDVLRNIDHDRTRSPSARDVERLFHCQRQIANVLDEEVVLHDRSRDADRVAFLEGVEPDRVRRHLAGHDHHRNRVHVGGGDTSDGIRHPRTRSDECYSDLTRRPREAVCGMHCGLFVAHKHMLDRVLLVQRVIDVEHGAARVTPEVLDAFGLKAANQDFGSVRIDGRGGLRRGGALDFCCRYVHFEPL